MENFIFTVNAVLPLFVVIAVGWLCHRKGLIDESNVSMLNRLSFRVLIPCISFSSAYSSVIQPSGLRLMLYSLTVYTVGFLILLQVIPRLVPDRKQAGVVIHASFRSNIVLFGISMAYNLFGTEGAGPSILLIATVLPFINVYSVVLLKLFSGDEPEKIELIPLLRSVATHPLIVSVVLGLLCSSLDITLPTLVLKPIRELAGAAAPLAMLALGARFNFNSAKEHWHLLMMSCSIKLILLPLTATTIGWLLGFRQYELGAIMICFSMPAASNVAAITDSEGGDAALAGEIVVFSSLFSCITLFIWVLSMKSLGLF